MVSAISSGSGIGASFFSSSSNDLQTWQTQRADLSDFYSDSAADLTSAFSTAASNQLSGFVNLAADAAAKRLGITLPSSSGSSSSASGTSASTAKPATPSTSGPTSAYTNIDQLLARLDGNPGVPAASASTTTPFSLNTFLTSLDHITAGSNISAPTAPTGANFSIASYLATLDKITSRPAPIVNTTA
jgi:hypothetical protein